ncbi:aldolase [Sinorhizobium alkalisoli]|uniref:Aldolase n=1 Tax=Sinorhizobium alkalisoli TaxID=1752398 RepID=A0A1E3V8Y6_9HYPH|nr:aldolase [Sinorhizobium alkalisoli]MCG5480862.1 aldolase [Sinorhizobium alkalisoli]ODR89571.1 aldolase [Sinorhizobium alkalisoli]
MIPQEAIERNAVPVPADHVQPGLVTQAQLVRLHGQNILFSASQRAIFALSETAADIWLALQEGAPPESIPRRILRGRLGPVSAKEHVRAALDEWERLGLIRPPAPSISTCPDNRLSQTLAVAGRAIRIVYPAAHAFPAITVFSHLEVQQEKANTLFELVDHGDRIHLFRDGEWLRTCVPEEIATVLKGELLAEALKHGTYELALHAAALSRSERLVLLCGDPGAGKTTLTLALAHAGFGFVSDDVTLLNADGQGVGLPFAAAVKSGAWPLLGQHYPNLYTKPVFRRPDRKRVRYVVPKEFSLGSLSPRPIDWVLLLHRDSTSSSHLAPVDPVGALRGLLNGAFAPGRELSSSAFDVLTQVIGSARICRLTYSRLKDAVELIEGACR